MEEVKVIHSLDELFIYAYEVEHGAPLLPMKLEGEFLLILHMEGPSWDKRIDKRSAKYIVDLQSVFDKLIKKYVPEADVEKLLVKVSTQEGSWVSLADILPLLKKLVGKMTNRQVFVSVMTIIFMAGGYCMLSRYLSHMDLVAQEQTKQVQIQEQGQTQQKQIEKSAEAEMARELTRQIELQTRQKELQTRQVEEQERTKREALWASYVSAQVRADLDPKQYAASELPIRNIAKTMEERDTVTVGDSWEKIPADMAKKYTSRRARRSGEELSYADGKYIVMSRRYDEGEIVLELKQGGTTIRAYLSDLSGEAYETFMSSLDKHERQDKLPFSMELQLNVFHTKKKLKHAIIVKEGRPREDKTCVTLDSILP